MGLAEQNNNYRSPYRGVGGGEGREGGRKIFSALQTRTGDPCIVSSEIRWEMQTNRKLIC